MSQHIPAWKRITIKKQQQTPTENDDDDPLNITTHLATGSLTKKQKQKIIRGDDREKTEVSEKKPKTEKSAKKKEKLPREERDAKRQTVLKDQLRYLIDFYLNKANPQGVLPAQLYTLTNVRNNYPENFGTETKQDDEEQASSEVVDVWKFSKQKQNWLIKHFFNVEQLPVEYDELLFSYFKELRSPAIKDRVAAACKENVKQWNDYVEKQDEKMRSIVEGDSAANEKQEDKQQDKKAEEAAEEKEEKKAEDAAEEKEEKKEKEPELTPPDKRVVARSQQLLKLWQIEPYVELKGFSDDSS